jgi:hypothetical protein
MLVLFVFRRQHLICDAGRGERNVDEFGNAIIIDADERHERKPSASARGEAGESMAGRTPVSI